MTATLPARRRSQHGVTLMELLMVVTIVGILASIAMPTYRNYVIRTQRAEAKTGLLATASALERCFTRFNAYDNAGCDAATGLPQVLAEGRYRIEANALTGGAYTLHAVPLAGQADDNDCKTLTYNSRNVKAVTGGATKTAIYCWSR